jgi:FlaA1/EpsC-like NDP-sugar epimerase
MPSLSADLDQQLEELLAESIEGAQQREASAFDELTGGNADELVLFGAGSLGRRILAGLREIGIEPLCFVDSNNVRWGQKLDALSVIGPCEGAKLYGSRAVFVVTIWRGEGAERMSSTVAPTRM